MHLQEAQYFEKINKFSVSFFKTEKNETRKLLLVSFLWLKNGINQMCPQLNFALKFTLSVIGGGAEDSGVV